MIIPLAIGLTMLLNNSGADATKVQISFQEAQSVEEYVHEYFADIPVMIDVARCESRFRHFGKNGAVLRGELTPADVGVMQINETYHKKTADKMEINLHSIDGNLAYARYLFEKEGTTPWLASSRCWGKHQHVARK